MERRDVVVIGSSAGGISVLVDLVASLPKDFPGSIFIVQHLAPYHKSVLPNILSKAGFLKAVHPEDGEQIREGRIYVAPQDHHMLIEKGKVLVKKGPKENRFRPSIDTLFRSAAYNYGSKVIGIVLSGALDDGTSGLWSIKRLGGIAIVQNPSEATHSDMPQNVLRHVEVDHVVSVNEMGSLLCHLVREPISGNSEPPPLDLERIQKEIKIAAQLNSFEMGTLNMGKLSPFTCPECHGSLVCIKEGTITRFRCHTGHAYSSDALLSEISKKIEADLWNVVRGMEEAVMLLEETGKEFENTNQKEIAGQFYKKAQVVREQSYSIREGIINQEQLSDDLVINNSINE